MAQMSSWVMAHDGCSGSGCILGCKARHDDGFAIDNFGAWGLFQSAPVGLEKLRLLDIRP